MANRLFVALVGWKVDILLLESPSAPESLVEAVRDERALSASTRPAFPLVAIGASAGGLEALRALFAALPPDTGMAFVVVQHLDPNRSSALTTVLGGEARMPVVEVTQGMAPTPNRVHVMPSHADLGIAQGRFTLVARDPSSRPHLPIDAFFRALADDTSESAIGVVLSGSASDGTEGLRAIKAAGGITFAQDPATAQFRSMPESAIAASVVDFRLAPEQIAAELTRLSRDPYLVGGEGLAPQSAESSASYAEILAALRKHAHLDFRGYKQPTLSRRIARRLALRRVDSLADYAASLRADPEEARTLGEDILIHVTSFFRDPAVWEAIQHTVIAELVKRKEDEGTLRFWVPGCSTGEEVYSLAICILEALGRERRPNLVVKIFGSDLSAKAIAAARAGIYSEAELQGLGADRLAQFFERHPAGYRIGRRVRDLCVFVQHDLVRDPPFARLDLISCRNLLIYLDAELQRRVVPLLHHCLEKGGYLVLGANEGVGAYGELFHPLDQQNRIYIKTGQSPRLEYPAALGTKAEASLSPLGEVPRLKPSRDAQRQADQLLLSRYAPPGVVVNERLEVIQFRGRTGEFLESPPGQPQVNVLKLAREGLLVPLRDALDQAKSQGGTVRKEGLRLSSEGQSLGVALEVLPLAGQADVGERFFLVVFESGARTASAAPSSPAQAEQQGEAARLKSELNATREYLQAVSADHDEAAEQLSAANEELLAANEELQSTNEELQSAKEELQSTNEELSTVNDELRNRNVELDVVASDLVNLLESFQVPVIMVDKALKVRRFTPSAREISSLTVGDVGRHVDEVKLKVQVDDLGKRIQESIDAVAPREWEVQSAGGHWFRLHIRPYRTADDRLDGAILSFLDIDVLKRSVQDAEGARDYAQGIVKTVPVSLAVLDQGLKVVSANPTFYRTFGGAQQTTEGVPLFQLDAGSWDVPALRGAIESCATQRVPISELEVQCTFADAKPRVLLISGNPIEGARDGLRILLAIEDVTSRRQLEASEKQARLEAEQANRAKDLFLATLSHELRTPLSAILMSAQTMQKSSAALDPKIQRAGAMIERAAKSQARLIDDLLDISRIVSGKLMLDLQAVDLAGVVESAVDVSRGSAEAKGLTLELSVPSALGPVHGDAMRLQQVASNLITNAIKFTPRGGKITVTLEGKGGQACLTVRDTGIGMDAAIIPSLFDRFVQAESAMTRAHGGLGLGLAIVRHLVHVHGGEVTAQSAGAGQGSTFTVTLPVAAHEGTGASANAQRTVARSIAGLRVLLIEDDDDTREATASLIADLGAKVRAARSVAEGLKETEAFEPEVILCDIAMPGEDGYAFIRKLRSSPRGAHIPAAALTALAGEEDRRRALEAGFQMHLAKPIGADRLAVAIGTLSTWPSGPSGP